MLLTGAAEQGGFKAIDGRFARNGLLNFATHSGKNNGAVLFERLDSGAAVAAMFNADRVPVDISLRNRIQALMQNREILEKRAGFGRLWQAQVRRMLLWSTPMIR